MGAKPSACVDHRQTGSDEESEPTTTKLEKTSGSTRLRKRGGSRHGGSHHRFLKEDQFCGIAKIQLTSVTPAYFLFFNLFAINVNISP